jgi:benzoyl-CoA reductase/2-hydroxyglutaryl-CoA dehydratase subunit BcrC/BadD/HgdB
MEVFDLLTELDSAVVGDDLASCSRRLYPQTRHSDPFMRMAEQILRAPPDPTRGSSIKEREEHMLSLANRTGAKGIIFYVVKFCEPEYFDIPILQNTLKAAGLGSIMIEVDLNSQITNQIRTRLSAFIEMLS